ncbi:MAG: hypothetical protein K6G90_04405 [Clostridia bacterium]|nr:hypothetical protein [Clostridia bacterium]
MKKTCVIIAVFTIIILQLTACGTITTPTATETPHNDETTAAGNEETVCAAQNENVLIDGISVIEYGEPAENIVKVRDNLYWTTVSGVNEYYENDLGISDILDTVYEEMKDLLGYDPLADNILLIDFGDEDKNNNTNYFRDGFRIHLDELNETDFPVLIPRYIYELGHELTHFFIWCKAADKTNILFSPYNEEPLCEAVGLTMLNRLQYRIQWECKTEGYHKTISEYLNKTYLTNTYPQASLLYSSDDTVTESEYAQMNTDSWIKENWDSFVRYIYDIMLEYPDDRISEICNLYNHVTFYQGNNVAIDYDEWYNASGNPFIEALGRIQPTVIPD